MARRMHLHAPNDTTSQAQPTPPKEGAAVKVPDNDPYATHPLWLYFLDSEMEKEYTNFHFIESGCYGGKAYCFLAGSVSLFLIFIVYQPKSYPETGSDISFWAHVPLLVTASIDLLLLGALFVPAIVRWREYIILLTAALHWPTFIISDILGTSEAYNYTYPFVCFYFCCLIPLPRFFTMLIVLTVTPLSAFAAVSFGAPWHFDHHSHTEVSLWPFLFFALATLRMCEQRGRKAFAHGHRAREQLQRIDRQIELTQEMVVRYFPATPTAALVQSDGCELSREYAHTALVVTDLKGFTAYTNRTEPEKVIETVRRIFAHYDDAAQRFGMEKVSTVGDSYFAAAFPGLNEYDTRALAGNRAARAVAFAFAAIDSAVVDLPVRVGVHVGTVMGGFVGAAPPKFDLFGADADLCKQLEHDGEPGTAHVSHACADVARRILGTIIVTSRTPIGELWVPQPVALQFDTVEDEATFPGCALASEDAQGTNLMPSRAAACRALLALAADGSSPVTTALPSPPHGAASRYAPETDGGDSVAVTVDGQTNATGSRAEAGLALNYVLLRFSSASVEEKFRAHYAKEGPTAQLMLLVTFVLCYFLLCCQFMMCTDSMTNKLVLLALWVVTAVIGMQAQASVLHGARPRPIVMSVGIAAMVAVLFLAGDASCTVEGRGGGVAAYNLRNLAVILWDVAMVTDTLVLERPFVLRTAITMCQSAFLVVLIAVRRSIYANDDVGAWTWMPLVALLAHEMSSFSVDLVERVAFASSEKLRLTMRSAKGRELENAERALDVMLPRFATDKILASRRRREREQHEREAEAQQQPDTDNDAMSSHLLAISDDSMSFGSHSHQLGAMKIFWEIEFGAILFFALDDAANHPQTADGLVRSLEAVLQRHPGAVKIKSNGSYVLCAVGLNGDETDSAAGVSRRRSSAMSSDSSTTASSAHTDAAIGVNGEISVLAARIAVDVVHRVLKPPPKDGDKSSTSAPSWRVGINAGPVMGAVFGSQGVIFDVFGDTVNSASRVASTAEPNTITVTRAVSRMLDVARDANLKDVPAVLGKRQVAMKGLGEVLTFQLQC